MKYAKSACIYTTNYYNKNEMDLDENILSIKQNIIPKWICSKCTFNNIQRSKKCKICNNPYSSIKSNKYSLLSFLATFL